MSNRNTNIVTQEIFTSIILFFIRHEILRKYIFGFLTTYVQTIDRKEIFAIGPKMTENAKRLEISHLQQHKQVVKYQIEVQMSVICDVISPMWACLSGGKISPAVEPVSVTKGQRSVTVIGRFINSPKLWPRAHSSSSGRPTQRSIPGRGCREVYITWQGVVFSCVCKPTIDFFQQTITGMNLAGLRCRWQVQTLAESLAAITVELAEPLRCS